MHRDGIINTIKWTMDAMASQAYPFIERPFFPGYENYKRRMICQAIDRGLLREGNHLPPGYGVTIDERVVEYPWVFARLNSSVGKMLDAGSTFNHQYLLERRPLKGADLTIMTLAPEKRCYWHMGFSYVFGDLRRTMFASETFDTIASISTIEHIGLDNEMLYTGNPDDVEKDQDSYVVAIREFKRILKPGGVCLISVPFGRYANFGWFQVFDRSMIDKIVDAFGPRSHEVEYFGYTKAGWMRSSAEALKDATVYDVHSGKGWEDDRAASSRAIACLQLRA